MTRDQTIIKALLANVMDTLWPTLTALRERGYRADATASEQDGTITLTVLVHVVPPDDRQP